MEPPLPPNSIKTYRVDILRGEKRWLLSEAGEDEGREHQSKVDVEGREAERVRDLALGERGEQHHSLGIPGPAVQRTSWGYQTPLCRGQPLGAPGSPTQRVLRERKDHRGVCYLVETCPAHLHHFV